MKLQDKVEGMQKLLERESQRCQDLLNQKGGASNSDQANVDSSNTVDERVQGLQQIIARQNEMIDSYRQKLLALEKGQSGKL